MLSCLQLLEAIRERKRKKHTRAIARHALSGRAGRWAWARDMRVNMVRRFPASILWVRDFLLPFYIFTSMEKIALYYFG